MGQFGVGQPLRRLEDQRFLTGGGRYSDDISLPGQAHAALLRSPHAHAEIAAIDTAEALAAPGVLAIYAIDDLDRDGLGDIPCVMALPNKDGSRMANPGHPILARGRVRHVGDPVAFVVAETRAQARDAAELIEVDYHDLPAVTETAAAIAPGAPRIWPEADANLCLDWEFGDRAAADAAFAQAKRVTRLDFVNNRVVVNSMEPRVALGTYEAETDTLVLTTSSQGVHKLQKQLASAIFKTDPARIRVLTPDVGGGFGMKVFLYAEQVLVIYAARALSRPVRWNAERGEAFVSDSQGRDHVTTAELALDDEGRFLGLRAATLANMGAYLSNFATAIPTVLSAKMFCGLYRIPAVHASVKCVFTNSVPVDAYRGAGRPEAAYLIERLVDAAARELDMEPAEIRRRNFVPGDALPHTTSTGLKFDSGDFQGLMERAMAAADWAGHGDRARAARGEGKLRGHGMACYVEACSGFGEEEARVRLDADGASPCTSAPRATARAT